MSSLIGRVTPRVVKRGVGRARAEVVRAKVLGDLQRIARSGRPVLAGPWLGEVGFEILYWVPFLRWATTAVSIAPDRLIAVSRGGPASWYAGLARRYVDVLDVMTLDEFRGGNEDRRTLVGEQKQLRATSFDDAIAVAAAGRVGESAVEVLHPSLMYRLMRPFWWKHAGESWVFRHLRLARLARPPLPPALDLEPGQYVAAKFYFNDCVADSPAARDACAAVVDAVARRLPVVSLATGFVVDDHGSTTLAGGRSIAGLVTPRDNLAVQTALVANARAFVGTYGGFSYLAPLSGVPARALYTHPHAFDRAHLHVAETMVRRLSGPSFELADLGGVDPEALADEVARL